MITRKGEVPSVPLLDERVAVSAPGGGGAGKSFMKEDP